MFERTRYVRDIDGTKCGVVTILYENGKFGAGMSLCKMDEDAFDRKAGKELARTRALASLNNDNLLLKDLTHASCLHRIAKITGCSFPQVSNVDRIDEATENRTMDAAAAFIMTVHDMIYTLALAKVKDETV